MNKNLLILLSIMIPLFVIAQKKIERLYTESTFGNDALYNQQNNMILYTAISIDSIDRSINQLSIRIKDMNNSKESIINVMLDDFSTPDYGWLDSSHIYFQTKESTRKSEIFSPWIGHITRYNIFTKDQDTIPSPWFNSDNYVTNFYASNNKIFYTIIFKDEDRLYWNELSVDSKEIRTIKKFEHPNKSDIVTYQYLPESNDIIYIYSLPNNQYKFIRLSLSTGYETLIKTITATSEIETSVFFNNRYFYLERWIPMNKNGNIDLKNSNYWIKEIDINTGKIKPIYHFNKGVDVSMLSPFKDGSLLVSLQFSSDSSFFKKINLSKGGNINLELDPSSFIFSLKMNK